METYPIVYISADKPGLININRLRRLVLRETCRPDFTERTFFKEMMKTFSAIDTDPEFRNSLHPERLAFYTDIRAFCIAEGYFKPEPETGSDENPGGQD